MVKCLFMKVCVVLPALNEERIIANSCKQVMRYLDAHRPGWDWELMVVDNGSKDKTSEIVRELVTREARLQYLKIDRIGKGYAIKAGWQAASADVYMFMDADLATDLAATPVVLNAVSQEGYDVAVGSRYAPGAVVERDWLRRITSRGYWILLKLLLGVRVADAPCGFKAISRKVRDQLLPQVENGEWFFDTELLVRPARAGYRVKEIPVRWREIITPGRKSKVKIFALSIGYLRSVISLRRRLASVK